MNDSIILVFLIAGLIGTNLIIIHMFHANRKYNEHISTKLAEETARNTILLLGKLDENTDASSLTLSEATRTTQKIAEVKQEIKETQNIIKDKSV